MTGRAILFGLVGLITVFALMLWNGFFMHGDHEVECLPSAECEAAE